MLYFVPSRLIKMGLALYEKKDEILKGETMNSPEKRSCHGALPNIGVRKSFWVQSRELLIAWLHKN